jgi:hypothetical protein
VRLYLSSFATPFPGLCKCMSYHWEITRLVLCTVWDTSHVSIHEIITRTKWNIRYYYTSFIDKKKHRKIKWLAQGHMAMISEEMKVKIKLSDPRAWALHHSAFLSLSILKRLLNVMVPWRARKFKIYFLLCPGYHFSMDTTYFLFPSMNICFTPSRWPG